MKLIQRLEVCCYAHHISSLSDAQTELMMWKESLYASLHSNLVPLQVDKATSDLKNNNVRLKETLLKVINQNGWFYLNFLLYSVPWLIARYAERLALVPTDGFLTFIPGEVQQKLLHWHHFALRNFGNCLIFIPVSS